MNGDEAGMKRLDETGHLYALLRSQLGAPPQTIQFLRKEREAHGSRELYVVTDGTTNEDVLSMLIDRMWLLQAAAPCRENAVALTHLETALLWLEKRTRDRQARGVEGTDAP